MATLVNLTSLVFGITENKEPLPTGWHFEESPTDFLIAISPDGRRWLWNGKNIVHEELRNSLGERVMGSKMDISDIE